MWSRAQLKEKAKFALSRNYWKIVLVTLIVGFINGTGIDFGINVEYEDVVNSFPTILNMFGISALVFMGIAFIAVVIGVLLSIFVFAPLEVGTNRFYLKSLNQPAEINEVTFGFDQNYKNVVKILFFRDLYIFGWSLLFIIPGIIKAYEYYMVPYLLAENPNLTKEKVFELSKQMMTGQKMETFVLELSFFGWIFLSSFTWGLLGVFYVEPYRNLTCAALYEELSLMHGRPAFGYQQYRYENNYGYEEI